MQINKNWLKPEPIKSNQIKSLLLSHHHSTSALVSEILMSVLQTVQKNNRQFTYGRQCKKNCTGAFTVLQTVQKKKKNHESICVKRPRPILEVLPTFGVHFPFWRSPVCSYIYLANVGAELLKLRPLLREQQLIFI